MIKGNVKRRKLISCVYCRHDILPGQWYITDGENTAHLNCDLEHGRRLLRGAGMAQQTEGQQREV